MSNPLLDNYEFGLVFTKMLVGDIAEDQMCLQQGGIRNHPAWTLGHLAGAAAFGLSMLGQEAKLPDDWESLFDRGTTPVADRSKYPSKERLLAELDARHAALAQAYAGADQGLLQQPNPDEEFGQIAPTIAHALIFILTQHEWQHIGELCAWRQAMGLPRMAG